MAGCGQGVHLVRVLLLRFMQQGDAVRTGERAWGELWEEAASSQDVEAWLGMKTSREMDTG